MHPGLYLFTGPDGYFLDIELKKRQQSFAEKYGKENVISYTNDSISLGGLQEAMQGGGLFASKKLIICKGIPDDKLGSGKAPAQIVKFFESVFGEEEIVISPDIILVFVSLDPDKRLRLYKILSEKATTKAFPTLSDGQLITFLQQKLGEYFNQNLADYMISYVGNNLFRLEQEADKIITFLQYTGKKTLTDDDRDAIIYTPVQVNAFGVLDAVCAGNIDEASRLIDASSQDMTPRPEFLGMLYWGLKHMIQTVDIYNAGTKSAKDISAIIGMHFFPIVKNLKYIDYLKSHKTQLNTIFHELLMLDKSIKSGRFPQEGFWAEVKAILYQNLSR